MLDLADRAAIFLEEMNISGDEMVQMNHSLDDIPKDKIGAYYLHDLMAGFVQEQLNLHGVGSALPELIPLLISYFYPTTPVSNSDEMFKKRMQIIEILNDLKAD